MLERLIYTPVLTYQQALILRFHPYCFFNPALMEPKQEVLNQTFIKEPEYYCDSGGYQLYSINDNYNKGEGEKRCIVFPGVGKRVSNNYLILDPEYLCKMFRKLNVKFGFTMDYPMLSSTKKEFKTNLSRSFGLAKLMFKKQDELCPKTKFLIPLHFETKRQLEYYFNKMSSLNPEGFSFPGRSLKYRDGLLKVAYTLSYLHRQKVKMVHILGSSRAELIILCAAAIGLNMFERLSFDSTTWYPPMFKGRNYLLSPETLQRITIDNDQEPKIEWPSQMKAEIKEYIQTNSIPLKDQWWLANVMAIDRFRQTALELSSDVKELMYYVESESFLKQRREKILNGINMLISAKKNGFGFTKEWLDLIWD